MTVNLNGKPVSEVPTVHTEKRKIFYGWIIVAAGFIILFSQSAIMSSFGITIKPLADAFQWSRTVITVSFAILAVVMGLSAVLFGYLTDRHGPTPGLVIGALSGGLGLLLVSRITALWQFYLFFSVLVGIMFGASFVPLAVTISKWFVHKRGLALGICNGGAGVGGLALTPLMQSFILHYGWDTTFMIYGVVCLATIIPTAFLLKKEPAVMGLQPLGCTEVIDGKGEGAAEGERKNGDPIEARSYVARDAIQTGSFWMFALSTFSIRVGFSLVQVNLVPYVTDPGVGIPAMTAATALGVLIGANSAGALAGGILSDKIGAKRTLALATLATAIIMFGIMLVRGPWMLFVFSALFGMAAGACMPQLPRMTAWLYGEGSLGSVMGIQVIFSSAGIALGPTMGSFFFDRSGSYTYAFIIGGILAFASSILVLMLKLPRGRRLPMDSDSATRPT